MRMTFQHLQGTVSMGTVPFLYPRPVFTIAASDLKSTQIAGNSTIRTDHCRWNTQQKVPQLRYDKYTEREKAHLRKYSVCGLIEMLRRERGPPNGAPAFPNNGILAYHRPLVCQLFLPVSKASTAALLH